MCVRQRDYTRDTRVVVNGIADQSTCQVSVNNFHFPNESFLFHVVDCWVSSGASAVAFGAFGAHALAGSVEPKLLKTWETGAQYHLAHSLAVLVAAQSNRGLAAGLFTAGITLFSGSLYALVLTGQRKIGAITPVGGLLMIAGWIALAMTPSSSGAEHRA